MRRTKIRLFIVSVIALFLSALYVIQAQAYTVTGYRVGHTAVTYSCGNPELAQAVKAWADVSALTDGGCTDNHPDVTLEIVANTAIPSPVQGVGGAGHLWIPVRNTHHLGVITHEVGHALGMGHSADPNAAMAPYCCNPIGADDIAGIVSIYGPPEMARTIWRRIALPDGTSIDFEVAYQVTAPMLAR